jgi:hypothetical protein
VRFVAGSRAFESTIRDSQDQDLLQFFLNRVECGMTLRQAAPPGGMLLDDEVPRWVRSDPRRRSGASGDPLAVLEGLDRCQGRLRVIASIEEPEVIARILAHRQRECVAAEPELAPVGARAPPRQGRLL